MYVLLHLYYLAFYFLLLQILMMILLLFWYFLVLLCLFLQICYLHLLQHHFLLLSFLNRILLLQIQHLNLFLQISLQQILNLDQKMLHNIPNAFPPIIRPTIINTIPHSMFLKLFILVPPFFIFMYNILLYKFSNINMFWPFHS